MKVKKTGLYVVNNKAIRLEMGKTYTEEQLQKMVEDFYGKDSNGSDDSCGAEASCCGGVCGSDWEPSGDRE